MPRVCARTSQPALSIQAPQSTVGWSAQVRVKLALVAITVRPQDEAASMFVRHIHASLLEAEEGSVRPNSLPSSAYSPERPLRTAFITACSPITQFPTAGTPLCLPAATAMPPHAPRSHRHVSPLPLACPPRAQTRNPSTDSAHSCTAGAPATLRLPAQ
jgi:hypothetical protein